MSLWGAVYIAKKKRKKRPTLPRWRSIDDKRAMGTTFVCVCDDGRPDVRLFATIKRRTVEKYIQYDNRYI